MGTDIDQLLEDVRSAYNAGDDAAFADAIKALIAARQPQQQAAGRRARTSDTTAMAPITGKAARQNEAFWDGISRYLQKTGGRSL